MTSLNGTDWHPKWLIRSIFVAIPLVSAAQYQFIGSRLGETYPAVVMPVFGGSGGYSEGRVQVGRLAIVFITAGGDRLTFTPQELLSEYPDGHHGAITAAVFAPRDSPGNVLPPRRASTGWKSVVESMIYRVFPGLTIDQRNDPRVAESLRAWLRTRTEILAPGQTVDAVEFIWSVDAFSITADQFTVEHKPAGVLVMALEGP